MSKGRIGHSTKGSVAIIIYLSLFALTIFSIARRRKERFQESEKPPREDSQNDDLTQENKLDKIFKEQRFSTTLALWGIGLAVVIYSVSNIYHNVIQGVEGLLLGAIIYLLGTQYARRWIKNNRKASSFAMIAILLVFIVLSIISTLYIYTIPIG
jgi:hypothetical protein